MKKTSKLAKLLNNVNEDMKTDIPAPEDAMKDPANAFKELFSMTDLSEFSKDAALEKVNGSKGKTVKGEEQLITLEGPIAWALTSVYVEPSYGNFEDGLVLSLEYRWKHPNGGSNGKTIQFVLMNGEDRWTLR